MLNVEYEEGQDADSHTLIIRVDLKKSFGRSKSGKTIVVASTQGNQRIGEYFLGLNVYKYPEPKED